MKDINSLNIPETLRYAVSHEWAKEDGGLIVVGISDYAQDQLGDVVYVDLPEIGQHFAGGDEFGSVESVKAVSELYLPLAGEIVAVNEELADRPELVNEDPNGAGWLVRLRPDNIKELEALAEAAAYRASLEPEA